MVKKVISTVFVILLAGCCPSNDSVKGSYQRTCPEVEIEVNRASVTRFIDGLPTYQIDIAGYNGYCIPDEKNPDITHVVIQPKFEVTKLRETDVTSVQTNYFINGVSDGERPAKRANYSTVIVIPWLPVGSSMVYDTDVVKYEMKDFDRYRKRYVLGFSRTMWEREAVANPNITSSTKFKGFQGEEYYIEYGE